MEPSIRAKPLLEVSVPLFLKRKPPHAGRSSRFFALRRFRTHSWRYGDAALDRGTVDATINYTPFVRSYKHYEVAGHLTEIGMGQPLGYGGGINLKLFNKMPKNLQKILVETSDEYMDVYAKKYVEDSKSAKKALTAGIDGKKVQFHQLSKKERARWVAKAEVFTTDWIAKMEKKGLDAKGFIKTFNATRAKYEKELRDKGYPWIR